MRGDAVSLNMLVGNLVSNAVKYNRPLDGVPAKEALVIRFGRAIFQDRKVPSDLYADVVKEFGQQMVDDHKKAGQQVEQLAMKDGVQLSAGVNQEHKQRVNELSQLAGHAFDRAYMNYILQNHETTVEEFQREAKTVQDQDIKQWIISIVPILEAHREKARQVKYSLQTNP